MGLSYIYVVVPVFSIGTYYTFPTEGGYLVERRILDSEASPPTTTVLLIDDEATNASLRKVSHCNNGRLGTFRIADFTVLLVDIS